MFPEGQSHPGWGPAKLTTALCLTVVVGRGTQIIKAIKSAGCSHGLEQKACVGAGESWGSSQTEDLIEDCSLEIKYRSVRANCIRKLFPVTLLLKTGALGALEAQSEPGRGLAGWAGL